MRRSFSDSIRSVVTAGTISSDIHVIEIGWQPARRRVTVIAVGATGNVCRMFSGRADAIVT